MNRTRSPERVDPLDERVDRSDEGRPRRDQAHEHRSVGREAVSPSHLGTDRLQRQSPASSPSRESEREDGREEPAPRFCMVAAPGATVGLLLEDSPRAVVVTTLVTTSIPSSSSDPSTEPRKLDDLDAPGSIYAPSTWLRALWTEWSVEVRVLSGALEKPRNTGLFCVPAAAVVSRPLVDVLVA